MAFWQSVSPYLLFAAGGMVAAVLLTAHNLRHTSLDAKQQTRVVLSGGLCFFPAALCANLGNWLLFPSVWSLPFWTRFFAAGYTFYFGLLSYLLFFRRRPVRAARSPRAGSLLLCARPSLVPRRRPDRLHRGRLLLRGSLVLFSVRTYDGPVSRSGSGDSRAAFDILPAAMENPGPPDGLVSAVVCMHALFSRISTRGRPGRAAALPPPFSFPANRRGCLCRRSGLFA